MAGKVYKRYNVAGKDVIMDATWARGECRYSLDKMTNAIDALESAKFAIEHVANVTGIDQEVSFEISNALARLAVAMADAVAAEGYFNDLEEGKITEDGEVVKVGSVDNS